ncbi:hypothetical protein PV05_11982 [Exophiala xenobiotica]|jgi:hypothetical protein|uniref:Secreted protein n=1 Tax=Exophiala xenobiotica TaxID=348802 RepID=A0A0D2CKP0_9EURO|nr:uncharacterized protein PV05_11982 [Exophiala xenobiotica]KIW50392.1 hypothetical protein PV05_11982 [Exophiala xenobiotica]
MQHHINQSFALVLSSVAAHVALSEILISPGTEHPRHPTFWPEPVCRVGKQNPSRHPIHAYRNSRSLGSGYHPTHATATTATMATWVNSLHPVEPGALIRKAAEWIASTRRPLCRGHPNRGEFHPLPQPSASITSVKTFQGCWERTLTALCNITHATIEICQTAFA